MFAVKGRSIYYWLKKYKSPNSIDSVIEDGRGRPSKINISNGKKLIKIIKRLAFEFVFETDLWNTSRAIASKIII